MKSVIGAFLVMFAVFLIIGCNEDDASPSENVSDAVDTIMADFSAAMANIESYRTESIVGYVASEDDCGSMSPESAESIVSEEFVAPDRYHIDWLSGDEWREFIVIGDQQWSRMAKVWDSSLPPWREAGELHTDEESLTSMTTIVITDDADRFDMLESVEQFEDDIINGVLCFHLRGTKNEVIVDFWINKDNHLLMREQGVTVHTQENDEQLARYCITKDYTDFNSPITVDLPLGTNDIEN